MKIGLIVAIELDAVFEHYPDRQELPCPPGFKLYFTKSGKNDLYILRAGMGEIAAASGVQYLITACGAEVIVNFGVVGGLTERMKLSKVCVVSRVVHYKYDCSEFLDLAIGQVDGHDSVYLPPDPSLVARAVEALGGTVETVTCLSGDKFVGTEEEKTAIARAFEGDVCDMESAGIVLTCEENGVPCLLFKAVSDGLSGGAREFFLELRDASLLCLVAADRVISTLG